MSGKKKGGEKNVISFSLSAPIYFIAFQFSTSSLQRSQNFKFILRSRIANFVDFYHLASIVIHGAIILQHFEKEIISKIDRTQLIRVITNLVKNATQAIPEDQETKMVLVTIKRIANEVVITIKDNGTGIDPRHINTIFEPKFTTKNSGMGLGLGIIKNIIENYNGTITFETKFGRGTIFTVTLPIINA